MEANLLQYGVSTVYPLIILMLISLSFLSVENGHIKRITDPHIQTSVIEIIGTNVATCYITCPADPAKTLGIKLPFLVMIIKNVCPPLYFRVFHSFFYHIRNR